VADLNNVIESSSLFVRPQDVAIAQADLARIIQG
jgi:hypothetical protein